MTYAAVLLFSSTPVKTVPWHRKPRVQVLLSLVLGIAFGFSFPKLATQLKLLGDMFLSLYQDRRCDAVLAGGNLLEEDADDRNPHPTGIAMSKAAA